MAFSFEQNNTGTTPATLRTPTPPSSPGFFGTIANAGKAVGNFLTQNTQAFGKTIGGSLAAPGNADLYSQASQQHSDLTNNLSKAIATNKAQGKDTSKLQATLDSYNKNTPKLEDFTGNVINTTPEQVIGQGIGTGLEALSGGVFSSGAENVLPKTLSYGQKVLGGAKIGATYSGIAGLAHGLSNNEDTLGVLGDTAMGAGVGAVVGAGTSALVGGVQNIWAKAHSSSYATNLANATAANDVAGQRAVGAANEMSGTMTDVKTGLGNQFAEAPKVIEKADPTARLALSSDSIDALNKLKNTASFQLPEHLRLGGKQGVGYTPGSLAEIKNLYNLTPTDAQDLISRLNDLTFKSKASGDLAVNQQTVDLVNTIKNQAQASFGHITDAEGNSVWGRAYSDYQQGMDAVNAMGDIVHVPNSPGEMASPTDINKSMSKILDLQKTPQGRAVLQQAIQHFKDITGYDLTNPAATINKLLETQSNLEVATKGGHGHQLAEALKSPSLEARHVFTLAMGLLGVTAGTTLFRKQIGAWFSGQ